MTHEKTERHAEAALVMWTVVHKPPRLQPVIMKRYIAHETRSLWVGHAEAGL